MNEEIAEVISSYDDLAAGEFSRFEQEGARGKLIYEIELRELRTVTSPGDAVLDAGGAGGKFALPLAKRGREVHLMDLSGQQCRLARDRTIEQGLSDKVTVTRGDVRSLPYKSDLFDSVICIGGALSHVLDDIDDAVAELARVAHPGATAVTSVMNRSMSHKDFPHRLAHGGDDLSEALSELLKLRRRRERHEDIGPFYRYTCEEMIDILARHGLKVTRTRAVDRLPVLVEPWMSDVKEEDDVWEAIVDYEWKVSELPWFRNTGNMTLQVSRCEGHR